MNRMTAPKTFLTATPPPPAAPVGVKEILEVQRRMHEGGESLAQVNAKSQEIEKEIATLKSSTPPLPNFDNEHESMLADVALGKSTTADLVRLDREIHDAKKKYDATVKGIREKVAPLESTFAGLRRKAAIHNRTIEGLRNEHRRLCQVFLLAQAEEAGKAYSTAINAAVEAMARAIAFGSLHKRIHGENNIGVNYETFDVLGLGLESTKGSLPQTDPATWVKRFDDAEEAILTSLKAEGLAMPFPETAPVKPAKVRVPGIGVGTPIDIVRPEENRFPDGHVRPTHAITE